MLRNLRTTLTLFLLAAFSVAYHVSAVGQVVQNDVFWKDTNGNPIYSQGGGVLKVGNTYYWYGVKYTGADDYYNNPGAGKNSGYTFSTITCYSSTDLANWKFEGDVMTTADGIGGWVGRVGAAHNPNTGKFVLIAQYGSGLMFGTSSTPTGHFTLAGTQSSISNVVNGMSGDQSVFVDDDGTAYLVFSNVSGRSHLYVAKLRSSDYLYVEPATNVYNSSSGGREGNTMFKHNGVYYFLSSDLHGWNASHTYCITATNITGPYSSEFVMQGTDADFSHVTQTGLSFEVSGSSGSFVMFGGDRWCDFAGNGIGYNQWVPVTFNGTTPVFHSLSQWNINASAGTWSVGSSNNYVQNPGFEADRVSQGSLAGWISSGSANGNTSGSHNPGRWAMSQYSSSAYTATMYQNISLPNGTYTLSAWVKSSGGQNTANIYVKNFGGSEKGYSINSSIGSWTKISISNINVTNGSIEVGVYSVANAGNWVNADDFSMVSNGGSSCTPTSITPYVQVNGGSWQETSGITINSGDEVRFGPQPVSGGSWSWSGCGTSGTSREQVIYPTNSCTSTATYTNSCGATSSQSFTINVSGSTGGGSYVQLQNRATGLFLDGLGRTSNGAACGQYANTSSQNAQWELVDVGSGYYQLQNRATGLYLDGMGRTTNGDDCGQYANTTSQNSHWSLQQYSGSYYRIQNRATGLYLDGMGRTSNGDAVGQWANATSQNAQWQMINVGSGSRVASGSAEVLEPQVLDQEGLDPVETILFYPNPMDEVLTIQLEDIDISAVAKIFNISGQIVISKQLTELDNEIEVRDLQEGIYFVAVTTASGISRAKLIKQ